MASGDAHEPNGLAALTATNLGPLVGPWRPRDASPGPSVVGVVGGAGGAAAVVEDVMELGSRFGETARRTDDPAHQGTLALAVADAQVLSFLAPATSAAATQSAATASAALIACNLRLEALAAATRLAGEAYEGTEDAITQLWHLGTRQLAGEAAALAVVSSAAVDGLGLPVGPIRAVAAEVTVDGASQHIVDRLPPRLVTAVHERATDVVAPSAARTVTGAAALVYGSGAARPPGMTGTAGVTGATSAPGGRAAVERVEGPSVAPPEPGLAGAVAGVAAVSAARGDDHLVAVRRRVIAGPDGRREAYVVDLPGTDAWTPRTGRDDSPMDLTSDLAQLGGLPDDAYVDAVLQLLDQAPPGATVVLDGHSLGGITASTVAALAASRGRRVDYVVTAGSPVDTMRVPRGTTVVALANDADVVPSLDGMPARDVAGRTTIVAHEDAGSTLANHDVGRYVQVGAAADRLARTDPGLRATTARMRHDGAIVGEDDLVNEEVQWYRVRSAPRSP